MAEAIHAPALLIDHEQRRTPSHAFHLAHELAQMLGAVDVAPKQDDRVRRGLRENALLERGE